MGVVIESEVWEPNKALYVFTLISCLASIYFCPHTSGRAAAAATTVFDHSQPTSAFLRFQRSFLLLFSLSSVMEGLGTIVGEYEWEYYYGVSKEQMLMFLCVGCAASLCIGTFLGVISDLMGPKKVCLLFYTLQLVVSIFKSILTHPSLWFASFCLSLASSIFSFSFETWMVVEHDKLGQRQDTLNDIFWLMTFIESASFIGTQFLGNWLIGSSRDKTTLSPYNVVVVLAIASIIQVARGSKENPRTASFSDYWTSFQTHIFSDKRVWMLSWSQACVHLSISVFWILWAPTIVVSSWLQFSSTESNFFQSFPIFLMYKYKYIANSTIIKVNLLFKVLLWRLIICRVVKSHVVDSVKVLKEKRMISSFSHPSFFRMIA